MAMYLKYVLKNVEPVRISDDSTSQRGQTNTLKYIPGSTIRGLVISKMAANGILNEYKKALFTDEVRFLNGYLTTGSDFLIPSPKGFFEDKEVVEGEKTIINSFASEDLAGTKRASLGHYCRIDKNGCICYYKVDTEASLKISVNGQQKQSVFRNEAICANQYFEGYVRLSENEDLNEDIKNMLSKNKIITIGNARSTGLGKCEIVKSDTVSMIPYTDDEFFDDYDASEECYMMLLSDMTMRNSLGEYCGIDEEQLGEMLGVEKLKIDKASTSVKVIKGYNRTWGTKLPSVTMYESGSVFRLKYEGTITSDKMKLLKDEGIGIRRNEGYGRVVFIKNFKDIKTKLPYRYSDKGGLLNANLLSDDDKATLIVAAKGYYQRILRDGMESYVVNNVFKTGGVSSSKIGTVESILTKHRFNSEDVKESLDKFFEHESEKEGKMRTQQDTASVKQLRESVDEILNCDLDSFLLGRNSKDLIMGMKKSDFFSSADEDSFKLRLLIRLIRNLRKVES